MTFQTLLRYVLQWVTTVSLCVVATASNGADQSQVTKKVQTDETAATRPAVIYRPLLHDVSLSKAGGSTRGADDEAAILQVLAPDHTGLTLQAQPTLYWYARSPVTTRFKIVLLGKDKSEPLLEVEAGNDKIAGIQQLDLGDHDISLQPEVTYQWSVIQVPDKDSPSTGVVDSGLIERMEPGEGLTGRVKKSHGTQLANVYASEGIWYDALETISSMIDESPEDQGLVAIRASLLNQIGMHAAAAGK